MNSKTKQSAELVWRIQLSTLIAVLLGTLLLSTNPQAARAGVVPGEFLDTKALPVASAQRMGKWQDMLDRHRKQLREASTCQETWFTGCPLKDWARLLGELAGKDRRTQLDAINAWVNRYHYVSDRRNWRTTDYWATPLELMERGGDCEDYAIAKYLSLRSLGVSSDAMRVIIVKDMHRRRMHAVLLVDYDGQQIVLDNRYSYPVTASDVRHYVPLYSVNETGMSRLLPQREARKDARRENSPG